MNTPTITEIEAALDPLVADLIAAFRSPYCSIDRRNMRGKMVWAAWTGEAHVDGATPQEAIANAIRGIARAKARRKLELENELARINAELRSML